MAIFKDLSDFREDIPEINKSYNWNHLSKRIDQITRLKIYDLIGETLYTELETGYLADTLTGNQLVLVESYLQPAIAAYTYINLLSTNRINLGQMGVQQQSSADGTSSPASYHAIADVKEQFAWLGFQLMDQGLSFLDKHKLDFPTWDAGVGAERRESLVYSASVLNQVMPIGKSLQTYLLLFDSLKRAQGLIKQEFTATWWNALIDANKLGIYNEDQERILPFIKEFIVAHAILAQMPFVRFMFKSDGLLVRSKIDGPERMTPAQDNEIRELNTNIQSQKESAYSNILRTLEEYPDQYEHKLSQHTSDDGNYSYLRDNRNKKSFRA